MQLARPGAPTRTVVIDDDPTGTQSASGVRVLFSWSTAELRDALRDAESVYVLSNTRAEDELTAVAIVSEIRDNARAAAAELGARVRFVLRGDSTLRGHVFAEADQLMTPGAVMLFVPAFPAGGRTTVDAVHYLEVDGVPTPVSETEFADDPVFGFENAHLAKYVREKSSRVPVHVPLDEVRSGGLPDVLRHAPAGAVVLPDVVTDDDVVRIAEAVTAVDAARDVVVRSGAPLAAALAGVTSDAAYAPAGPPPARTVLVCGSHTAAATAQLRRLEEEWGPVLTLDTDAAMADPAAAGRELASRATLRLDEARLVAVASERQRRASHGTLDHGRKVMDALVACVAELATRADLVVSKGGITSAEVARVGIGSPSALVRGQVLAGVSVWQVHDEGGRELDMVVVPGNVGADTTLVDVLGAYGVRGDATGAPAGGDRTSAKVPPAG